MANEKFTVVGTNIQEKASVIWNVADLLRGPFKPHEYGLVILPNSFIITKFIDRSIYVNMLCDYWLFPHSSGIVCPRQGGEDMRSIIEELYYGNIAPANRDVVKGGEYSKLMHLLTRNEEDLEGTLTQA